MTDSDPEDDPQNYYEDGYWRCGRADDCGLAAGWGTEHVGVGACKLHGGNAGAPEGNDNAVTHGAWRDSFVQNHLREDEIERLKQGEELLGTPETAQEIGRSAAMLALEQYRRSGDDRFLRRFESICDTFEIAPTDELEVSGEMDIGGSVTAEFITFDKEDGDDE